MWYRMIDNRNIRFAIQNRQRMHEIELLRREFAICDTIGITREGWLLYSLYRRNEGGYWDGEFHMILCDGDHYIENYTISDIEFWDCPSMPRNWAIPF